MEEVSIELERLFSDGIVLADFSRRWEAFLSAYKAHDDARRGEDLPVHAMGLRPATVATPLRQSLKAEACRLAWGMLADGIPNAKAYSPIGQYAAMWVDDNYGGETDEAMRNRMRLITRRFGLHLTQATAEEMAADSFAAGEVDDPPIR